MPSFFKSRKSSESCRLLETMDAEQTARYRHFRALLDHNRAALNLMADLEQTYYDNRPFTIQLVERKSNQLLTEVAKMVRSLSGMSGKDYGHLAAVLGSLRRNVRDELAAERHPTTDLLTLPLTRI